MSGHRAEMRAQGSGSAPVAEGPNAVEASREAKTRDVYFSADIETDGPIPGEFSMLSFALVYAGTFDGESFHKPASFSVSFEATLKPISERFEVEALRVNGLDRDALLREGRAPELVMQEAAAWVRAHCAGGAPVLVAYPLSFDWSWLYWYFVRYGGGSPFNHSRCFDLKTAIAVKGRRPVVDSGHDKLPEALRTSLPHTHRALDDAMEQADMLAKFFAWDGT